MFVVVLIPVLVLDSWVPFDYDYEDDEEEECRPDRKAGL
jgi:hypothetical protein